MGIKGFLNNLVSNIVSGILVLGGGALIAVLRHYYPNEAPVVLYGLAGATSIAVLLYAVRGHAVFSLRERVTPKNVEEKIKKWSDALGIGVAKPDQQLPESLFSLRLTLKSGTPVAALRMKNRPEILQLQNQLTFSPEHQAAIGQLAPAQAAKLIDKINIELARSKIGYTIGVLVPLGSVENPQNTIFTIVKGVRINDELDRERFVQYVDEIDSGTSLVKAVTALNLDHNEPATAGFHA